MLTRHALSATNYVIIHRVSRVQGPKVITRSPTIHQERGLRAGRSDVTQSGFDLC